MQAKTSDDTHPLLFFQSNLFIFHVNIVISDNNECGNDDEALDDCNDII